MNVGCVLVVLVLRSTHTKQWTKGARTRITLSHVNSLWRPKSSELKFSLLYIIAKSFSSHSPSFKSVAFVVNLFTIIINNYHMAVKINFLAYINY